MATLLVTVGCTQDPATRKQAHFDRGNRYFTAKKYPEAVIELRNVLALDPRFVPGIVMLGRTYAAQSWYEDATAELERALEISPDNVDVLVALIQVQVTLGAWDEAMRFGELLRLVDATNPWGAYAVGAALKGEGKPAEGAVLLREAINSGQPRPEFHKMHGDILAALKRPAEAESAYRAALALEPKFVEALIALGIHLVRQGQPEAGRQTLLQAREVSPDNPIARLASSVVLSSENRLADAIKELEAVRPEARTVAISLALANMYLEAGRHEDAVRTITPMVQLLPRTFDVHYLHGHALLGVGRVDKAIDAFQDARAIRPDDPLASYNLALAYQRAGRHQEALVELDRVAKPMQQSPDYHLARSLTLLSLGRGGEATRAAEAARTLAPNRGNAYGVLGTIAVSQGDVARAREMYQRVAQAEPNSAEAYVALGHLLARDRRAEDALREYEAALQRDPKHFVSILAKTQTLIRLKRSAEALSFLEERAAADPTNPRLLVLLGHQYAEKKDFGAARASYRKAVELADSFMPARLALAHLALAERKDVEAEEQLSQILKQEPGNVEAAVLMAGLHLRQARLDLATTALSTALKTRPDAIPLKLGLAEAFVRQARHAEALVTLEPLVAAHPRLIAAQLMMGVAHLGKGNPVEASKHLDAVNKIDPGISASHLYLGRARRMMGDVDGARRALQTALDLDPGSKPLQLELGFLTSGTVDPQTLAGRIDELKAVVDREPGNVVARHRLATAYVGAKRPREAEAQYLKILETVPGFIPANLVLGLQRFREGKTEEGVAFLQAVLRSNPQHLQANIVLADHYENSGNRTLVINHLEAMFRSRPDHPGLRIRLAESYAAMGRIEKAIARTREAVAAEPRSHVPHRLLGSLLLRRGDVADAIASFSQATKLDPKDFAGYVGLGNAHEKSGDVPRAMAAYRTAVELAPRNPVPYNNLAWLYASSGGDLKEALALAQRARAMAPNSPPILDTLGYVHYKRGEYTRAAPYFREAAKTLRNDPKVHYHLGMTMLRIGRNQEAIRALRRSLELDSKQAEAAQIRRVLLDIGA